MIIERKGRGKELDKLFKTAIMYVKNDRELDLYKMIMKYPDLLNWTMDICKGMGLLHRACEMNKVSILDALLLPLHVNENLKTKNGHTPLMIACMEGHTDCVSVLLGPLIRTSVNAVNNDGYTALLSASHCNSASCIPLLIDGGADVNAVDNNGFTALHTASNYNSLESVLSLIVSGADTAMVSRRGKTALDLAKEQGHTAIVDLLTK